MNWTKFTVAVIEVGDGSYVIRAKYHSGDKVIQQADYTISAEDGGKKEADALAASMSKFAGMGINVIDMLGELPKEDKS